MNCHATRAVLDLYAEGCLSERRAKSVAAHLAGCPVCRALAARAPAASTVRAPQSLKERLLQAAKSSRTAPVAPPKLEPRLWPTEAYGVAVAAVALLAIALAVTRAGTPDRAAVAASFLEVEP